MRQILLLALAITFVAAAPTTIEGFGLAASNWFTTNWNYLVLSIVLPVYSVLGFFYALGGQPLWFSQQAFA